MNVDIVVGGQFGSEAKGLVASYLSFYRNYDVLVGVNSSQAGHTSPVFFGDKRDDDHESIPYIVNRQLPSSSVGDTESPIVLGPGSVINLEVLYEEVRQMEELGIPVQNRLWISDVASIITKEEFDLARSKEYDKVRASRDGLDPNNFDPKSFGSTKEGVSQSLQNRTARTGAVVRDFKEEILKNVSGVSFFPGSVLNAPVMQDAKDVLLEGSQGYGLSYFSLFYPFCTSRDCSASGFLSMAGLPPSSRDVYGVFRTFPIRVAGNSGPLVGEVGWDTVTRYSGSQKSLSETTTVTGRTRRVGIWDDDLFVQSVKVCGINHPILTFVNYLNVEDEGVLSWDDLSPSSREFIEGIEGRTEIKFYALSTAKWGGFIVR